MSVLKLSAPATVSLRQESWHAPQLQNNISGPLQLPFRDTPQLSCTLYANLTDFHRDNTVDVFPAYCDLPRRRIACAS